MILQTGQPKCSGGGGGASRRTFELPAGFAGRSANIAILLLAVLKAELVAPSCGTGAGGKLVVLVSGTMFSELLELKKLVLM